MGRRCNSRSRACVAQLLTDVLDGLTVDAGLTLGRLVSIFEAARSVGSDQIETFTLSEVVETDLIAGAEVLRADPVGARAGGAEFTDGRSAATGPDSVASTSQLPSGDC